MLIAPVGILAESREKGPALPAAKEAETRRQLQAWYVAMVREKHGAAAAELGYAPPPQPPHDMEI